MRSIWVEDIVVPIGFKEGTVAVVVTLVGGDPVGAVEYCKEIWKEIDEHQQKGARAALTGGREKIVATETANKSNR